MTGGPIKHLHVLLLAQHEPESDATFNWLGVRRSGRPLRSSERGTPVVATAAAPMRAASLSAQFSRGLAVFSGLGKGMAVAEDEYSGHGRVRSDRWDESRAEEWMASLEYLPSLSEALAIKMIEDDGKGRKAKNAKNKAARKKHKKQRSGISLVGGMLCSKKAKSR